MLAVAILMLGLFTMGCGNILPGQDIKKGTASFKFVAVPKEITTVSIKLVKDSKVLTADLQANNTTNTAEGTITDLEVGDWAINVDAKDANGIIKFSGSGSVTIKASDTAEVSINLTAVAQTGSLHITISFPGSGTQPPTSGKMYAVISGVGDYAGSTFDLTGPPMDVANLKQVLETGNTQAVQVTTVLNSAATKAGIKAAIDALKTKLQPGDDVIFYFSGHGCQGSGTNYEDESVVTYDALGSNGTLYTPNLLTDNDLESWFVNYPTKDIVFMFDTCYSGGMVKPRTWTYGEKTFSFANPVGMAKDLNQAGYTVMMASDKLEYSLDTNMGGLYTYFLVDGLSTRGADVNADRMIKPKELHDYAYPKVVNQSTQWGSPQHPQLYIGAQAADISLLTY